MTASFSPPTACASPSRATCRSRWRLQALRVSYEHLRAGRSPAGLKEQAATPDLMKLVLGQDRYDAWTDDFL